MVKIMENPMKIYNLGVPLFLETTMCQDDVKKWQEKARLLYPGPWN